MMINIEFRLGGDEIHIKDHIYSFAIWIKILKISEKYLLEQNQHRPMFLLVAAYKWYCDHVLAYLFRRF